MLWIILTILITIVVIRLGRRFSWSPAHILNLEGYEWLDDFFNWILIQYDWSKLCILISESVQEQFKKRAPPGWTLKLEGPPSFLSSNENTLTFSKSSSKPSHYGESPHVFGQTGEAVKKPMDVTKVTTHSILSNLISSSAAYPISVKRVQTLWKNFSEVVLAFDVKVNFSQDVFITSRQTSQLESSRCRLDLVKLTGQIKLRLARPPNENTVDASICFAGPPKVNIHIPRYSFQREETILALDLLLRESIGAFGVKLPLLSNAKRGVNTFNPDGNTTLYSNNLQEVLQNEVDLLRNRLHVKILKANSLYCEGNHEVYCRVSVDSPPQTQRTSSVADSPNPFFGELLTFQLDGTTKRVSFEVHEKSGIEASIGRADFLLKDASEELAKDCVRVVLPLMSQHPTSHMSLTVEISSTNMNLSLGQFPKHETNKKTVSEIQDVKNVLPLNLVANPSINIEGFLQKPKQASDHVLYPSQWRNDNSQTDSNLSLVSQASLMVRNNSNESAASKGRTKQKSLIDAMKKKFHGKRSRSAEPTTKQSADASTEVKIFSDGIYLTPPPKRVLTPGHLEHWSLSSSTLSPQEFSPSKKRGKMSSFKNFFRRKNQSSSPSHVPVPQN